MNLGPSRLRPLALAMMTLLLAGCAAQELHRAALEKLGQGQIDAALADMKRLVEMEPGNARYRIDYLTQRALATQKEVLAGDEARRQGQLDAAALHYQRALSLDDANEPAQRGLLLVVEQHKADVALRESERLIRAGQTEPAEDVLRRATKDLPGNASVAAALKALQERVESDRAARDRKLMATSALHRPVTLQFRDANLKMVFEALSRTANVNIILDRDVKSDLRTTIYVKDATVEDTIDLILLQNQLEKRVLNQNTLFVYPSVGAKQKEYSELKVRSFQISNIDAANVASLIKTLLKTKDIVTDARTNTLVMRDTPEAIAVAEKIIAANDVPDPEVMLEVQVLEVSADRLSNLGIKWPDSFGISTPTNTRTLGDLKALTRNDLAVTPIGIALNLMLQDTSTNILASPRIRARNKEKAKILVGDKVPVITNLLTPQQAGQTSVITGSIQYVDVGIKLEVEPQVYVDNDVGIKINLEVSNIAKTVATSSGVAYQIGTRSAQTSLRLKDGETQVLAGLINEQDRSTASKVPGLGQVPIVGHLFSSDNGNGSKSEIVLSITPHIVRPQTLPEARVGDIWSGTESIVRDKPLRLDPAGAVRSGDGVAMPSLVPGGTASSARGGPRSLPAPGAAEPQPEAGPKAGGAGGSRILGAGSGAPSVLTQGGATAAGAPAAAAAPGLGTSGTPYVPATPSYNDGTTTTTTPTDPKSVPATIRPGRALAPAAPSSPAGKPVKRSDPPAGG